MADSRHITRRSAIIGAVALPLAVHASPYSDLPPDIQAEARVRELARELSEALNSMSRPVRVTIEPSETGAHPVLMEDINRNVLVDHLATMSRGLKMMEGAAMARDPNITSLGMVWGIHGARYEHFAGVAVSFRTKPE